MRQLVAQGRRQTETIPHCKPVECKLSLSETETSGLCRDGVDGVSSYTQGCSLARMRGGGQCPRHTFFHGRVTLL